VALDQGSSVLLALCAYHHHYQLPSSPPPSLPTSKTQNHDHNHCHCHHHNHHFHHHNYVPLPKLRTTTTTIEHFRSTEHKNTHEFMHACRLHIRPFEPHNVAYAHLITRVRFAPLRNNFPLRGKKAEPWEGGTRVMAFLTGGFLPASLRGQSSAAFVSIADW
jgi:hypothetical protein